MVLMWQSKKSPTSGLGTILVEAWGKSLSKFTAVCEVDEQEKPELHLSELLMA